MNFDNLCRAVEQFPRIARTADPYVGWQLMFILKQQHKQGHHFVKDANFGSKNTHASKCRDLY